MNSNNIVINIMTTLVSVANLPYGLETETIKEVLVKVRKTDDPEYFKKYYTNNRQKFLEKAKQLIKCPDCQKVLSSGHLNRHKLSKDHIKAIEPSV